MFYGYKYIKINFTHISSKKTFFFLKKRNILGLFGADKTVHVAHCCWKLPTFISVSIIF